MKKHILITALFVFFSSILWSQGISKKIYTLSNVEEMDSVQVNDSLSLYDGVLTSIPQSDSSWHGNFCFSSVQGAVVLKIKDNLTQNVLPDTFTCRVDFSVRYWTTDNQDLTDTASLWVSYDKRKGIKYREADLKIFNNAHYIKITVTGISNASAKKFLEVAIRLNGERSVCLSAFDLVTKPVIWKTVYDSTTNRFNVYLKEGPVLNQAEEFDVEWTFVDQYDQYGYDAVRDSVTYGFKDNSTRIVLGRSQRVFSIENIFEEGYVIFRYRTVAYYLNDNNETLRVTGAWSNEQGSDPDAATFKLPVSPHESDSISVLSSYAVTTDKAHLPAFNWQYLAVFAEDGKRKETIQYFDGSLRGKQTLANNRSDNTVLVQENIYDFNGRPAIEILPVPVQNGKLTFYPDFNRNTASTPVAYSAYDFDTGNGSCSGTTDSMSTSYGASRYYSSLNAFIDTSATVHDFNKYVPVAGGYPFVQTEFMPDNTGRVRAKSGIGVTHSLLPDGKKTTYAYETPFQEELDRLFGAEVGYNVHYKKSSVVDANGQPSVTYTDLKGKTIATALAANPGNGMNALASNASRTGVEVDLITGHETEMREGEIVISKKFNVLETGNYKFKYSVQPLDYLSDSCTGQTPCYDCIYDLEISLVNLCGDEQLDGDQGTGGNILLSRTIGGDPSSVNASCTSDPAYTFAADALLDADGNGFITANLVPGTYTIRKKLTVNKEAFEKSQAHYLANSTCKTLAEFEAESFLLMDTTSCEVSCATCSTTFANTTEQEFVDAKIAHYDSLEITLNNTEINEWREYYRESKEKCEQLHCGELSVCETYLDMLRSDVSPGGQYAAFQYASDGSGDVTLLHDVTLNLLDSTGTYSYTDFSDTLKVIINGQVRTVKELSVKEFLVNWKKEWADLLVSYHPEYCEYTWCANNQAAYDAEQKIRNISTFKEATDSAYIYNGDFAISQDEGISAISASLENKMNAYVSVKLDYNGTLTDTTDDVATAISLKDILIHQIFCSDSLGDSAVLYSVFTGCVSDGYNKLIDCDLYQDLYWQRLSSLYLQERRRLLDSLKQATCALPTLDTNAERRIYSSNTPWPGAGGATFPEEQDVTDALVGQCESQCESYRIMWADKLQGCNLDTGQMNLLTEQLKLVCINGCDEFNPLGSSSVAPAKADEVFYLSFEQVMRAFPLNSSAFGNTPIYNTKVCSDLQLTFPVAYGHDYFAKTSPYADTCACQDTDSVNCPCKMTSKYNAQTNMANMTRTGIADSSKCDHCIDCPTFLSLFKEFYQGYKSFDSATIAGDLLERNTRLRDFMNKKLGFNLFEEDYVNFAAECMGYKNGFDTIDVIGEYATSYFPYTPKSFLNSGITLTLNTNTRSILDYEFEIPVLVQQHIEAQQEEQILYASADLSMFIPYGMKRMAKTMVTTNNSYFMEQSNFFNYMNCMCDSIVSNPDFYLWNHVGNTIDDPSGDPLDSVSKAKILDRCTRFVNAPIGCYEAYSKGVVDPTDEYNMSQCTRAILDEIYKENLNDPILIGYNEEENPFGCLLFPGPSPRVPAGQTFAMCAELMPVFELFYENNIAADFEPDSMLATDLKDYLMVSSREVLVDSLVAELNRAGALINEDSGQVYQVNFIWNILRTCRSISCDTFMEVAYLYDSLVYQPIRDTAGISLHEYILANPVTASTTSFIDSLNRRMNKPPFINFFDVDEASKHFISCAQPVCKPVTDLIDSLEAEHPELFTPGLKITQVLRDTANQAIVENLLTRVNAILIRSPYFKTLDKSELVASVDMCWTCVTGPSISLLPVFNIMKDLLHPASSSGGSETIGGTTSIAVYSGWSIAEAPYLDSVIFKNDPYRNALKFFVMDHAQNHSYLHGKVSTVTGKPFYVKFYTISSNAVASGNPWSYMLSTPPHNFSFGAITHTTDYRLVKFSASEVEVTFTASYRFGDTVFSGQRILVVMPSWPFYDAFVENQECRFNTTLCNKPLGAFTVTVDEDPCIKRLRIISKINARNNYEQYVTKLKDDFYKGYMEKCLRKSLLNETFKMKYDERQYHYTLYYYDQAGNLVKTIPPAGVKPLNAVATAAIGGKRDSVLTQPVAHEKRTVYAYNTLNELIWQRTPDASESNFWYDALGRIVLSQNAKQKTTAYSYTIYDALGRISEAGEATSLPNVVNHDNIRAVMEMNTWLDSLITEDSSAWDPATRTQITNTYYDEFMLTGHGTLIASDFENLRGRVVHSTFRDYAGASYQTGVHYSYDIHGNVKRLYREITALSVLDMGQDLKTVDYKYDLISGKVNEVVYQQGMADQYIHRYTYDEDNRITSVFSGITENTLDEEADYQYYKHGPLARTEIGEHDVQGLDYVYTIQGWLKSVNASTLGGARDPGHDAYASVSTNAFTAKDVFGFELSYFHNDYTPVSSSVSGTYSPATIVGTSSTIHDAAPQLYNGNIRYMVTNVNALTPILSAYQYDQLNRITSATYFSDLDSTTNAWSNSASALSAYYNAFEYDADGNITKQVRNGEAGRTNMDNLTYNYTAGTNRLVYVTDTSGTLLYNDDIDNQASNNYAYDSIGNLVKDLSEDITSITWTVYGKISRIKYDVLCGKPDIEYQYTPDGHRAVKIVTPKSFQQLPVYTYYVRDAQGNVMATYERRMRRIVDFEKITFTQANDRLTTQLGSSNFQSFIGELHTGDTLMKDSMYNRITGITDGSKNFLFNFSPVAIVAADTGLQRYILTHITAAEYKDGVKFRTNYRGDLFDIMESANASGQTLFQWLMRNLSNSELQAYIIAMNQVNPDGFNATLAYMGLPAGSYYTAFASKPDTSRINALTALGLHTYDDVVGIMGVMNIIPNVPEVIFDDIQGAGGLFSGITEFMDYLYGSATSTTKQKIWQYIFDYKGSANAALGWYRDNAGTVYMTQAAAQQRVALDTIQAHHTLYSTTNNMEQYFTEIQQRRGQSTYDAMTLYFYNLWRTYTDKLSITERHIYGSSRLGVNSLSRTLYTAQYEDTNNNSVLDSAEKTQENYSGDLDEIHQQVERGYRRYELSNHLGNVLAVVSDKHIPVFSGATFTYYEAELLQASDYSPFGAPLAGRTKDFISALNKVALLNQDFDTSTTVEGWSAVTANTTASIEGGRLKYASTFSSAAILRKSISTTPGKKYRVSLDMEFTAGYNNNSFLEIISGSGIAGAQLKSNKHYVLEFIANATSASIQISMAGSGTTRTSYIDNVKLEEITSDEGSYRFGFNGKEMDNEASGNGNQYDYGFRIYNPRLGRFLSVDPLTKSFPMLSTYQYASNTPIQAIDLDGLEGYQYVEAMKDANGNTCQKVVVELDVYVAVSTQKGSLHYSVEDLDQIQANLNNEYNNGTGFVDANGNTVEFRFNIKTFDADKTSPKDFARNLKRDPSNFVKQESSVIFKGIVLDREPLANGQQGYSEPAISRSVISSYAVDPSHTMAHEIGHEFLNYDSSVNPITTDQHTKSGGIFQYKIEDFMGNTIQSTQPVNQSNVELILKTLPSATGKIL